MSVPCFINENKKEKNYYGKNLSKETKGNRIQNVVNREVSCFSIEYQYDRKQ